MAVTVTEQHIDENFATRCREIVHPDAHSLSVTTEGQLYLFDHAPRDISPGDTAESRAPSSPGHTVAIYAPGRWVKAVRS